MAVIKLEAAYMLTGGAIPTMHALEDESETYERGAVLIPVGAQIGQGATEPTDNICGVAVAAATGTANTDTLYVPALSNIIFKGSIGTSTSAGAPATSDLLQLYPLALSAGDWFVDKTDNSNPCVRVVAIDDDQIGVTNGFVYFHFISDATVFAN